ncbi:MAG: NUDIX hydrolase [Desulfomonilaceae bacterium]|nr:NUDIX hydrolase [Desulfomonilaceae bacterium]
MSKSMDCPHCGKPVTVYRNPIPTVDIIIRVEGGIILIERKNPPFGWALPGGFIDYGERAEDAAVREAKEETSLTVKEIRLFGVYSDPHRDPRHHTLTVVYAGRGEGQPRAADDATRLGIFGPGNLPKNMAFDHAKILEDYFSSQEH